MIPNYLKLWLRFLSHVLSSFIFGKSPMKDWLKYRFSLDTTAEFDRPAVAIDDLFTLGSGQAWKFELGNLNLA